MLTLYFAPGASSFAVHIALHEIGVPFEGKPMSFRQNDMQAPEFLALNPEGKVPTLVVDGRPLTEVAAILFYLAKRFPEAGLLPLGDIEAEAQALSWMYSLLPRCTRRGSAAWTTPNRSMALPTDAWAAAGRSAAIRSPIFICSGCIGGSSIH